jgi:ParB-like chromosome segregation protein Spo0J
MELIKKKVSELIPYINNSRTHSEEQITQLVSSIKEFGFTNPILLAPDNSIIAGHGRLQAVKRLGHEEVPCIIISGLSKTQIKALIIADNQLALNAGWDLEKLSVEIEGLEYDKFDLKLLGFEDELLKDLLKEDVKGLIEDDETPEVDESKVKSKLGDLWLLGNHRLLCGDSTLKENIDKLMNNEKAQIVFTDPPYGMKLNTDYSSLKSSLKFFTEKGVDTAGKKYNKVIGDNEDFKPDLIYTVLNNFDYCKEIFLWGADYYAEYLKDKNNGSWVVWDKRLQESSDKMYGSTFELCWSKAKHKRMLARVKWAGIFGTEKEFDKKRHHPTQKPIALVEWFFDYFSLKDKINVVDLYGGSGSTLIASEKHNKKCFMMELDNHYTDVIINRWQQFTGKEAIHEQSGKTYNSI